MSSSSADNPSGGFFTQSPGEAAAIAAANPNIAHLGVHIPPSTLADAAVQASPAGSLNQPPASNTEKALIVVVGLAAVVGLYFAFRK